MHCRHSARVLVLDPAGCVLLFGFAHTKGALAGQTYWATPGGAVETGETFEAAASRELSEETGLEAAAVGPEFGRRQFVLRLPSGERVMADERFFLVRISSNVVCRDRWTDFEKATMADHRWWSPAGLAQTAETVFPEDLLELVRGAAALQAPAQF